MNPKILLITDGMTEKPSVRLRILPMIQRLQGEYDFSLLLWKIGRRHIPSCLLRLLYNLFYCDLVFIHKVVFGSLNADWINTIFHLYKKPFIFSFDDAIYSMPPTIRTPQAGIQPSKGKANLDKLLCGASSIIAGNSTLAKYAARINPNVTVIPTVLDLDNLPIKVHSGKPTKIVGWVGTNENLVYLQEHKQVLIDLSQKLGDEILFRVVSGKDFSVDSQAVSIDNVRWSLDRESADVLEFDIGLMPLSQDVWAKGKSGFKAVYYQSLGIPVVSTPHEYVVHGRTGFHARTDAEWVEYTSKLVTDDNLRKEMGRRARLHAEKHFSLKMTLQENAKIFQRILEETHPRA